MGARLRRQLGATAHCRLQDARGGGWGNSETAGGGPVVGVSHSCGRVHCSTAAGSAACVAFMAFSLA